MKCGLHGGPVCTNCCMVCGYHREYSGLYTCTFRTPEQKKEEARIRIQKRLAEEERRITAIYMAEKKARARAYAIKKEKERRRAAKRAAG